MTESLHAALKVLRHPDRTRHLWIDAICIHQAYETERNHQVAIMKAIYNSATGIIIWLGDHGQESDSVMTFIQQAATLSNRKNNLGYHEHSLSSKHQRLRDEALELFRKYFNGGWNLADALENFISRPYFSRRWILQEVSSARPQNLSSPTNWVHCGSSRVPLYLFRNRVARAAHAPMGCGGSFQSACGNRAIPGQQCNGS